jgi:hypothetical protein
MYRSWNFGRRRLGSYDTGVQRKSRAECMNSAGVKRIPDTIRTLTPQNEQRPAIELSTR